MEMEMELAKENVTTYMINTQLVCNRHSRGGTMKKSTSRRKRHCFLGQRRAA